jgi:glycosyltransferase involved in cell wall biosynthesis
LGPPHSQTETPLVLISHIIPSWNQAGFIRRCLDGCLAQSYRLREVIVVDGLSTDGTQEILKGYGDRIRWVSEADAGQADAVNKGVRMAQGGVIAWINGADYYAHDHVLARIVELFELEPELDVVYGDGLQVDTRGRLIKPHRARALRTSQEMLILPSSFVMQPAVFFRKEAFGAAGGLNPDLHWAPDYDLWLRLFPMARAVRYVPEVFAYATYHGGAKSIRGMLPQIREVCRLKLQYRRAFHLSPAEQAKTIAGMGSLYAYLLAVKLKLRRAY